MKKFLMPGKYIDSDAFKIKELAKSLANGSESQQETAQRCFEHVRDSISHSGDFRRGPITCKASDVLTHKTGYCYAKSHLLAALLRANNIPAALCYQRLSLGDSSSAFCLHGLNAVYLREHGWYRVDPRGNKDNIQAEFDPPSERLAFTPSLSGEIDVDGLWSEPHPHVVRALTEYTDIEVLEQHLPDI